MDITTVIVSIFVAVLGSNALFGFIQYLIQRKDLQKAYVKKEDLAPIKDALMVWMQGELDKSMTRYINEGNITINQFKHIQAMVKAYEGLGGDGYIHELYAQVTELIGAKKN